MARLLLPRVLVVKISQRQAKIREHLLSWQRTLQAKVAVARPHNAFGLGGRTLDMLNLVYHETQDEQVYQVHSRRLKDKYDISGGLLDMIDDDSITSVEEMEEYIRVRQKARATRILLNLR